MKIKWSLQADHVLSRYTQTEVQQREPFYSGKTDDSCNAESGYKNHKTNQQNVNIYWIQMNNKSIYELLPVQVWLDLKL